MNQKKNTIENLLILAVDIVSILLSISMAHYLRYGNLLKGGPDGDPLQLVGMLVLLAVVVHTFIDFSHHFTRRGYFEELLAVVKLQAVLAISLVFVLYLMHISSSLSRLVFTYFLVLNTPITYAAHLLLKQYMIKGFKKGRYSNRILFVTTQDRAEQAVKDILNHKDWTRILIGIALLDAGHTGEVIDGIPVVADLENLMDYVIHNDVDEIFIMDSGRRHMEQIRAWMPELVQMGINVDVNIDTFDLDIQCQKQLGQVGKYAVVTFARNIFSTRQMFAKRMLDIVGSLVGMVLLAIATIFVAPAIKLESPGPVFFGQTRIGKNGRRFTFYKFRSMYQDAEERKKELMAQNEVNGLMFKMKDDPRITKVGKFIRKTSIDELPQFWNVLRGDMSLVGTRPPTVDEFERYEAKHKGRLSMTPGLTGLWQISGRSDIMDFDDVVKLDMQYIDHWSILKDIKILISTVYVVIVGKGSR
jgi:exopolysaccharide biosynthesis polyprenyl glycosylphosphotransferase